MQNTFGINESNPNLTEILASFLDPRFKDLEFATAYRRRQAISFLKIHLQEDNIPETPLNSPNSIPQNYLHSHYFLKKNLLLTISSSQKTE